MAKALHPLLGKHIRVEHWANALHQPEVAAGSMLGERAFYERVPYFFTDQYDLGMEYAGYTEPGSYDDVVVRGDLTGREFIAFWLADGGVLAGMNVNIWDVNDAIQHLVRSGSPVKRAARADPDVHSTSSTPPDGSYRPERLCRRRRQESRARSAAVRPCRELGDLGAAA